MARLVHDGDMSYMIEQTKKAIQASGLSRYRIAQESGVSESALSRLVSGERPSLSVDSCEAILATLGYRVRVERIRKGK